MNSFPSCGVTDPALTDSTSPAGASAGSPLIADIHIPFEKFTLDNGLTVMVHENRRAPLVAINIWYKVGAKDEPPGKTGFAHLFEHLMFGGSAHLQGQFIAHLNDAGASNLNGTTSHDRTNYYETVPTAALDYALFAESDRMGHFFETINQEVLEAQRGVVQNEKRQKEGAPYGLVAERIMVGTHPAGHPYAHTVIGSMEDIQAATLDDVRAWFKRYYAPSNAVLTLAGDIDAATAKEKVTRYFGAIPPGPPLPRQQSWIAKMSGVRREVLEDRVPQAVLHMVWNIPEYGHPDLADLGLLSHVLTNGVAARLRRRLVLDDKTATSVSAGSSAGTIAGQFSISAHAVAGVELSTLEKSINEELQRIFSAGVTAAEVERGRTRQLAGFLRHLENIAGIADMLSMSESRLGTPDAYLDGIARLRAATPESVRSAAIRWLSDGVYILHVLPFAALRPGIDGVDRSRVPQVGATHGIDFPALSRDALSNGLRIILAERHELPLVQGSLLFDVGLTAEPCEARGVGGLLANTLLQGAGERDSQQFSEAQLDIGAEFGISIGLEVSRVGFSAMKARLEESLQLYADAIIRPRFSQADFDRERHNALQRLSHEFASAGGALGRVLPGLMFPVGHPYARPMSGSGLPEHLTRLTREDVVAFHARLMRPQGATLVIVGDTTMAQIKPMLERCFADWKSAAGASDMRVLAPVASPPKRASVYLIDKPDSPQALIAAATLAAPIAVEDSFPAGYMHRVLGGDFSSRLNMNLREDKHWAYGAGTEWHRFKGAQLYMARVSVQTDKVAEAMSEVRKELADIVGSRPVSAAELARVQRFDLLRLGGRVATSGDLSGAIQMLVTEKLADDYWQTFEARASAVTVADVNAAARAMLDPERLTWVVIGDLARIESAVRALDFGPVTVGEAHGADLYPSATRLEM